MYPVCAKHGDIMTYKQAAPILMGKQEEEMGNFNMVWLRRWRSLLTRNQKALGMNLHTALLYDIENVT